MNISGRLNELIVMDEGSYKLTLVRIYLGDTFNTVNLRAYGEFVLDKDLFPDEILVKFKQSRLSKQISKQIIEFYSKSTESYSTYFSKPQKEFKREVLRNLIVYRGIKNIADLEDKVTF